MPAVIQVNQIDALCSDLQQFKTLSAESIDAPSLTDDERLMVFECRRKALLTRLENQGIRVRGEPMLAPPDER